MKTKTMILAFCMMCTALFAEQKVLIVKCDEGEPKTAQLEAQLGSGWRVVTATPVQESDSISLGKPKQGYTKTIVYILEKDTKTALQEKR